RRGRGYTIDIPTQGWAPPDNALTVEARKRMHELAPLLAQADSGSRVQDTTGLALEEKAEPLGLLKLRASESVGAWVSVTTTAGINYTGQIVAVDRADWTIK